MRLKNRSRTTFSAISAAHCFQPKFNNKILEASNVSALLGRLNLTAFDEYGSKTYSAQQIVLHHDWDFNDERYDADIALVILKDVVEFSLYIRAACLPSSGYTEVTGDGTIVGWGKNYNGTGRYFEPEPSKLIIPAINGTHCYTTFNLLARYVSNRAFCGGYENQGKSPCAGDSGGGFYTFDTLSESWIVYGIICGSLVGTEYGCDVNKFSVYTNVSWFIDWLKKNMEESIESFWKYVDFDCSYLER